MARRRKKGSAGGLGVLLLLVVFGLLVQHWQAMAWIGGGALVLWWLLREKFTDDASPPVPAPEPPRPVRPLSPPAMRPVTSEPRAVPASVPAASAQRRHDDDGFTVTVTLSTGATETTYRIPPPAPVSAVRSRDGSACWKPAGETAFVKGQRLDGGLLYVGSGLGAVSGEQVEAALPVDRHFRDFRQRELGYWSSYSLASERGRAAYLAWLADGRQALILPAADEECGVDSHQSTADDEEIAERHHHAFQGWMLGADRGGEQKGGEYRQREQARVGAAPAQQRRFGLRGRRGLSHCWFENSGRA